MELTPVDVTDKARYPTQDGVRFAFKDGSGQVIAEAERERGHYLVHRSMPTPGKGYTAVKIDDWAWSVPRPPDTEDLRIPRIQGPLPGLKIYDRLPIKVSAGSKLWAVAYKSLSRSTGVFDSFARPKK